MVGKVVKTSVFVGFTVERLEAAIQLVMSSLRANTRAGRDNKIHIPVGAGHRQHKSENIDQCFPESLRHVRPSLTVPVSE